MPSFDFKRFPELTNSQMDLYYFQSPHKQITEGFMARVINTHDGDTIRVETDFRNFSFPIRFLDIAAPELKEKGGRESQRWLENEINKKEIYVEIEPKNRVGKFGRLLGRIFLNGININQQSIEFGYSVPFDQKTDNPIPDFNKEMENFK